MAKNTSVMGIYPDRTTVSDAIHVLHDASPDEAVRAFYVGYQATGASREAAARRFAEIHGIPV